MSVVAEHILEFDPLLHRYTLDGVSVPGVTTVINDVVRRPELERWREWVGTEEADRIRDEAAEHGTLLHSAAALIADDLEDIPFGVAPDFAESYDEFGEWFTTNVDDVLATEMPVYDATWKYAGTADLVARLKGRKTADLIDLKTTWSTYPTMRLQTAAYRKPAAELLDVAVGGRLVICVPRPKPGMERKPLFTTRFENHTADWNAWTACLMLYRWQRAA